MNQERASAELRIGELSRRVGVSEHVLRAWESRYGLLKPARSAGGYRLYSEDDQSRIRRMQAHLADGLAAAQAARAAIADEPAGRIARAGAEARSRADLVDSADALRQALDEVGARSGQCWPGAFRQSRGPRANGGPGSRMGKRPWTTRPSGLPARRAA